MALNPIHRDSVHGQVRSGSTDWGKYHPGFQDTDENQEEEQPLADIKTSFVFPTKADGKITS